MYYITYYLKKKSFFFNFSTTFNKADWGDSVASLNIYTTYLIYTEQYIFWKIFINYIKSFPFVKISFWNEYFIRIYFFNLKY